MATTEARENVTNAAFRKRQKILDKKLKNLIFKYRLTKSLRLDTSTIATDIESVLVSKKIGAADFLVWLRHQKIKPEHYYTFGDREGDLEVPVFLQSKGRHVTCVFTGGENELKKRTYPFEPVRTRRLHDKGVIDFFLDHKNLLPVEKS